MRFRAIDIPPHVKAGIRHRKSGFPKRIRFFSGDVETCKGHPITLQMTDNPDHADIYFVSKETILATFLHWIRPRLLSNQVNVCFFHSLSHDLPALLYNYVHLFSDGQFTLDAEGVKISVLAAKIYYAKITFPDSTMLHVIDSFRFYTTSLKKIGKSLGCKNTKLDPPKGLGKRRFRPNDEHFVNYALQDALLGWEVGKHIIDMHRQFDVPLSISAPQFAARVFTRYYLKKDEVIKLPNSHIVNASLASYHGGKNGFYVYPGFYRKATEIDISSAYPNAMKKLPQFVKGHYENVAGFDPSYVGVYKVTGNMKACRYSIFLTHEGKAIRGPCRIENLWVTSFELAEALRTGEFVLERCTGWRWNPDPDYPNNALAAYVDKFYTLKENCPRGNPEYLTYKLLLNALYGKFIQNIELGSEVLSDWIINPDGTKTRVVKRHKAGGLFHPFIATLITGEVRAYLHRLEHDFKAIHASTDSIKTLDHVAPEALPKGLGGLNVEITGDCILLRNKLYLHFEGEKNGQPPKKYALHGFWGSIDQLLDLISRREVTYRVEHLYKVREALNQGLVPLRTYTQERKVEIAWKEYQDDVQRISGKGAEKESGIEREMATYWLPLENEQSRSDDSGKGNGKEYGRAVLISGAVSGGGSGKDSGNGSGLDGGAHGSYSREILSPEVEHAPKKAAKRGGRSSSTPDRSGTGSIHASGNGRGRRQDSLDSRIHGRKKERRVGSVPVPGARKESYAAPCVPENLSPGGIGSGNDLAGHSGKLRGRKLHSANDGPRDEQGGNANMRDHRGNARRKARPAGYRCPYRRSLYESFILDDRETSCARQTRINGRREGRGNGDAGGSAERHDGKQRTIVANGNGPSARIHAGALWNIIRTHGSREVGKDAFGREIAG